MASRNASSSGHMTQPHMSHFRQDDLRAMAFKQGMPQQLLQTAASMSPSSTPTHPSSYTPRKYLKVLVHVLRTLIKHQSKLSGDFLAALKVRWQVWCASPAQQLPASLGIGSISASDWLCSGLGQTLKMSTSMLV